MIEECYLGMQSNIRLTRRKLSLSCLRKAAISLLSKKQMNSSGLWRVSYSGKSLFSGHLSPKTCP